MAAVSTLYAGLTATGVALEVYFLQKNKSDVAYELALYSTKKAVEKLRSLVPENEESLLTAIAIVEAAIKDWESYFSVAKNKSMRYADTRLLLVGLACYLKQAESVDKRIIDGKLRKEALRV